MRGCRTSRARSCALAQIGRVRPVIGRPLLRRCTGCPAWWLLSRLPAREQPPVPRRCRRWTRRTRSSADPGRSAVECCAGGHHRRPAGVHGVDDLARVDPLQVGRGRAEVAVPELALDDVHRHPLARELNSMSMPQLMLVPTSAQPSLCRHARYADVPSSRSCLPCSTRDCDVRSLGIIAAVGGRGSQVSRAVVTARARRSSVLAAISPQLREDAQCRKSRSLRPLAFPRRARRSRRNRPLGPATARFGSPPRARGLCRRQCDGHPNVHRLSRQGRHNERVGIMMRSKPAANTRLPGEFP